MSRARHAFHWQAVAWTVVAMLAFAGNSVICRLALIDQSIDPASFTGIRLAAGAFTLFAIVSLRGGRARMRDHGSWLSAVYLFLYALCFSFAYVTLSTGSGALILFGFVQGTMIVLAISAGERPIAAEWLGWCVAACGLVWLLLPGVTAPPLAGAALMAVAGIAWGGYSVLGRRESQPLASTTSNFVRTLIMVVILVAMTTGTANLSPKGIALAVVSGGLTSGLGYVTWYAALNYLSSMQAALIQLSVPAIAAAGGVLLVAESVSFRLMISGLLILGGICIALAGRYRSTAALRRAS